LDDSKVNKLDAERYIQRYTPRTRKAFGQKVILPE